MVCPRSSKRRETGLRDEMQTWATFLTDANDGITNTDIPSRSSKHPGPIVPKLSPVTRSNMQIGDLAPEIQLQILQCLMAVNARSYSPVQTSRHGER